jgi:hypothetical protein
VSLNHKLVERRILFMSTRPRLRGHCGGQKMTVAAMQIADMKVWAQRS